MLKKLILGGVMALVGASAAMAQTSDYKKTEFFAGYSNSQVDTGVDSGNDIRSFFNDRRSFNGFNAAGVYNISRYVGIKGDISGAYRNQRVSSGVSSGTSTGTVSFNSNRSLYNFLGGVQIKDNSSDARIKPFAHALIGAGHQRFEIKNATCTGGVTTCPTFIGSTSDTGLAGVIGGGLDVKVSDKIDIRAIQVDYNPARFNGNTQQNVRFGVGIVIK